MSIAQPFGPYSSARPLIPALPAWVGGQDAERVAAYELYERIYWNMSDSLRLIRRGSEANPIFVPTAKRIIETFHRFLAPGFTIAPDPEFGSTQQQQAALLAFRSLFRRERFRSTFVSAKRYGLIRGDWVFHVVGDEMREPGSRISIYNIDPASYFPIWDDDEAQDVRIGCHLIEHIMTDSGDAAIYRLTYRKVTEAGGPSPITVEASIFKPEDWGGPGMEEEKAPLESLIPPTVLPAPITSIPVYHIKNFDDGSPFGSSELRGMERLLGAVNQSITDEDLALALEALGVYVTDSGPPIDPDSQEELPWDIGPGRVVELEDGKTFDRVDGIRTVSPYQDHLKYLHQQIDLSTGTPDIAQGIVDVQVAESGIALEWKMGPMVARAEEREEGITDVMVNMFFDLKSFFAGYEGQNLGDAIIVPAYGQRLPVNRAKQFEEIMALYEASLVSGSWTRAALRGIGYEFPEDTEILNQILEEKMALAQVEADVTGARIDKDLEEGGDDEEDPPAE